MSLAFLLPCSTSWATPRRNTATFKDRSSTILRFRPKPANDLTCVFSICSELAGNDSRAFENASIRRSIIWVAGIAAAGGLAASSLFALPSLADSAPATKSAPAQQQAQPVKRRVPAVRWMMAVRAADKTDVQVLYKFDTTEYYLTDRVPLAVYEDDDAAPVKDRSKVVYQEVLSQCGNEQVAEEVSGYVKKLLVFGI
mmetsp:Transcript_50185/g.83309  ORF Transcript_50185/g.83309 Transcript_50185/m.83309 type:complete len:198 (-) Transcript_50185:843-1436(-)